MPKAVVSAMATLEARSSAGGLLSMAILLLCYRVFEYLLGRSAGYSPYSVLAAPPVQRQFGLPVKRLTDNPSDTSRWSR